MKRFASSFVVCILALSVVDIASAAPSRGSRVGVYQNAMSAGRMPSIPVTAVGVTASVSDIVENPTPEQINPEKEEEPEKDMREKEREACIRNNIGVGNTFVWASRYSDVNNYSTMIEDLENPENNTCFVRVELKSTDTKLDLSDIPGRYFEMGRNIICGSWVDEDMLEKRILDAKKSARTWATVGGAVGGAALGLGSMELFGNKLIGGAVEGQKGLDPKMQFRSYILSLDDSERQSLMNYFNQMNKVCNDLAAKIGNSDLPDSCNGVDVGNGIFYSYEDLVKISAK